MKRSEKLAWGSFHAFFNFASYFSWLIISSLGDLVGDVLRNAESATKQASREEAGFVKDDFKDDANWDDLKLFQCGFCGLVCRFALRAYVNEPTRHGPCMHYFCSHCADAVEDGEYFACTRCSPERLLQKNCLVPDYAVDQLVQIHLKEGLGRNYSHAERPRHYETDTSAQAKQAAVEEYFRRKQAHDRISDGKDNSLIDGHPRNTVKYWATHGYTIVGARKAGSGRPKYFSPAEEDAIEKELLDLDAPTQADLVRIAIRHSHYPFFATHPWRSYFMKRRHIRELSAHPVSRSK